MNTALKDALLALLRPLVRYLIGRGWTYPQLCELLKTAYVAEAEQHYGQGLPAAHVTDSRITLLTGIHRKDVKRLRGELSATASMPPLREEASLSVRVVSHWLGDPAYLDEQGRPLSLPFRAAGGAASFERLARELKADMRARSILDELLRTRVVSESAAGEVSLLRHGYVSALPEDKLAFLGANVGDHLLSALYNLEHAETPFFERAVYYDALPAEDLQRVLPAMLGWSDELLRRTNDQLMPLDREGVAQPAQPLRRMRLGVYYYEEEAGQPADDDHPHP